MLSWRKSSGDPSETPGDPPDFFSLNHCQWLSQNIRGVFRQFLLGQHCWFTQYIGVTQIEIAHRVTHVQEPWVFYHIRPLIYCSSFRSCQLMRKISVNYFQNNAWSFELYFFDLKVKLFIEVCEKYFIRILNIIALNILLKLN